MVDTNGNTMTITYTKNQGAIYPNRINYTSNKNYVIFTTESRTDAVPQYNTLALVVMAKRLKTIEVYGNGQLSRKYVLDYQYGTSSKRSRLIKVQVYGSNGSTALPPMTFGWQEGNDGHFGTGQPSQVRSISSGYFRFADINGDGRDDFVMITGGSDREVYAYLSQGNTFGSAIHTTLSGGSGGGSVYLFDVDSDGKADLVKEAAANVDTYHSNGDGSFVVTSEHSYLAAGSGSGSLHIGDVSGDGLADIVVKINNLNTIWTHLSNGDGFFASGEARQLEGLGVEGYLSLGDVNGDGFTDIVMYPSNNQTSIFTFFSNSNGDGTFSDGINYNVGVQIYNLQIADVNGDGLGDLTRRHYATLYACLSKGDGTYGDCKSGDYLQNLSFADINGDGYVDLVGHISTTDINVYLGKGDGTFGNSISDNLGSGWPPFFFADINGDGLSDIVHLYSSGSYLYTYANLAAGAPADLLTTITNGLGATTTISYEPSSQYSNTLLSFIVNTVSSITVNDGNGVVSTYNYTYSGGYYDYDTRDFWGFNQMIQTNPDGTTVTSLFHQDQFRKGRAYRVDLKTPSGTLLTRQALTWQTYPTTPTTWAFVKLAQNLTYFYNSPMVYAQEDYTYSDSYGYWLYKTASGTGAENVTSEHAYANMGAWLWRLGRETITGSTSGKVRETTYGYDGYGNMISKALWLNTGGNPTVTMTYDSYGNRITETDPKGNTTVITYETVAQTYPRTITYPQTNGVSHIVTYEAYDYRFGQVTQSRDENNNLTSYAYDPFGRLIQTDYPDGGQQTIAYYDTAPRYTLTKVKEAAGQTVDTYQYFDGLDRKTAVVTFGESAKQIDSTTHYDTMGRVDRAEGPYFHPRPAAYPYAQTSYDYRGRPTQVTTPDATYGTVTTTYSYSGLATTITDPDSKQKTETRDYLGRITQVTEYADTGAQNTTYAYNAAGDLLQITDPVGNTITHTYDTLGRKIAMDDPDLGYWEYTYDANGNLVTQTDAKNQTITFAYDALNRVISKTYSTSDPAVTYTYDNTASPQGIGRLYSVRAEPRAAPAIPATYYAYDQMGRVKIEKKGGGGFSKYDAPPPPGGVPPSKDYATQYTYDLAGKPTKQTYPDNYKVTYAYYPGSGLLYTATGSDSEVYAACTLYEPTGKMGQINHGNGTATRYTYDPKSTRLTSIVTTDPSGEPANDIQRRAYTYSRAGDITVILDDARGITYTYTYDKLHRLIGETSGGVYPQIGYAYNGIGNITQKTVGANTYAYAYDTAHKHAVKTITFNGTNYNYLYDETGNMIGGPDFTNPTQIAQRTITYNADNMPTRINHTKAGNTVTTDLLYDGTGQRVRKTVSTGSTTNYIGDHFEIKDSVPTKYIFAGNLRVAKVTPSARYYYHKDHLSSSSAMTDDAGTVVEQTEYWPFGDERDHAGEVVSDYKFTDQELDTKTGLYNYDARHYDAAIGRFISADPLVQNYFDPQTLNRYTYARNNPLIYIDPSGFENYVFFDPKYLRAQAQAEAKRLTEGNKEHTTLIPTKTKTQFKEGWKNMKDTSDVTLVFHGSSTTVNIDWEKRQYLTTNPEGATPLGNPATYIGDLAKQTIDTLKIYTCEGGNLDVENNVARTFLDTQDVNKVIAVDGPLSYTWFTLEPKTSNRGSAEFREKYGRDPKGLVEYKKNEKEKNKKEDKK